jgi:hypothetical protein
MTLDLSQHLTEISTRDLAESKAWPTSKTDNLAVISEQIA